MNAFEQATAIRHQRSINEESGRKVVETLLRGRQPQDLSQAELLLLATGYNWLRDTEAERDIALLILRKHPSLTGPEQLQAVEFHITNGLECYANAAIDDETPGITELLSIYDSILKQGWGPRAYWHLRKAHCYLYKATCELIDAMPGSDAVWYPEYLSDAAREIEAALAADSEAMKRYPTIHSYLHGVDLNWNDRFAPLFVKLDFQHLIHPDQPVDWD